MSTRIVFLGLRCAFSVPPLHALLAAGFDVRAVILPAPPGLPHPAPPASGYPAGGLRTFPAPHPAPQPHAVKRPAAESPDHAEPTARGWSSALSLRSPHPRGGCPERADVQLPQPASAGFAASARGFTPGRPGDAPRPPVDCLSEPAADAPGPVSGEPARPGPRPHPIALRPGGESPVAGSAPAPAQPLPEPTIVDLARAHGVPVYEVARLRHPQTLAALAALEPDVIAVACFPRRLPPSWLALPRLGALNLHPSLLPDNRGPEPLFWTFRRGDAETGVTVHLMAEALDAGDSLVQRRVPVPDGVSGAELERTCAAVGAECLVKAIRALAEGRARPVPQDPARATTFGAPTPADFEVTPDRPARWAFTFCRGAATWGTPVVVVAGRRFPVVRALGYDPAGTLEAPFRLDGHRLALRCRPGVLHALVAFEG